MEDFVKFETAKLAEEKGFEWICKVGYNTFENTHPETGQLISIIDKFTGLGRRNSERFQKSFVTAPKQNELQKWLREQHDIHIIILYSGQKVDDFDYDYEILYFEGNDKIKFKNAKRIITKTLEGFSTYEKALEKALFKSLELIL